MVNLTRPWCRTFIVDFCGDCEHEHEHEHEPIRLVFGPGVVSQLWRPPEPLRSRLEFAEVMTGSGGQEWAARVNHPTYLPPGYSPHDAGDG